jgi:glycosyltransferase involved in cell wall biosynthesis
MLTVLFATWNRAAILRGVLDAYCKVKAPEGGWSLVIIDNGSTDDTQKVIAEYLRRLPLAVLVETRPGKNAALNTGLAAAEGDLYVFTDDDVYPSEDWLCALRRAADAHPKYNIFGGRILPRWETAPAQWILDWVFMAPVFTLTDPSWPEGPMEPWKVFGPNMAVRALVFAQNKFDASIGPNGSQYAMGSETEFVKRLTDRGNLSWHVRGASVEHFVRTEQLNREWILGRAVRFGRGQFRLFYAESHRSARTCGGIPVRLLCKLIWQPVSVGVQALSGNPQRRFRANWELNYLFGHVLEARRLHTARRRVVAA